MVNQHSTGTTLKLLPPPLSPPRHQDGITGVGTADIERCSALLDFALELLELLDDNEHAFEGILALMLQADVSGFAEHSDAKRKGATAGVPHNSAGGLGQKHADGVAAQETLLGKPLRASRSAGFFIGNKCEHNPAIWIGADFLQHRNGIEHGDDAALHVASAAAKEELLFTDRLKLCPGLRGNHVIVAVKIQRARASSVSGHEALGRFSGTRRR